MKMLLGRGRRKAPLLGTDEDDDEGSDDDWRRRPLNREEDEEKEETVHSDSFSDDEEDSCIFQKKKSLRDWWSTMGEVAARWTQRALASATPFQVDLSDAPERVELEGEAVARVGEARRSVGDDVIEICVIATGHMSDDPKIIHPLVRTHLVDATTGRYLEKQGADAPPPSGGATTSREKASVVDAQSSTGVNDATVDRVLPVATPPCRLGGRSIAPVWNHTFLIDLPFRAILSPDVLILFELVDFRHSHHSRTTDEEGLYGVAWAFLRPVVDDGVNVATSRPASTEEDRIAFRLQLFEYKHLSRRARHTAERRGLSTPPAPASADVPAVYLQYLLARYEPLASTMLVRVHPVARPEPAFVHRRSRLPTEYETSDDSGGKNVVVATTRDNAAPVDVRALAATQRRREPGEACVVPDRLLARFVPAQRGALTVRFSPTGRLLAVACCEAANFPVRLFDVASPHGPPREGPILVAELDAHHGMTYDLVWSDDEAHLVTASADGTTKLWAVNKQPTLVALFRQPTYVYAAALVSGGDQWLRVVTGAHDGSVRYWDPETSEELGIVGGSIHHQGMVNAIQLDSHNGRLLSADSFGCVVIWKRDGDGSSVDHYALHRSVIPPAIAKKSIVSISLHPRQRRGQLLVQAQPNCLKLLDLTTTAVVADFPGCVCQSAFVRSIFSPDGQFVLAGADDGRLRLWEAATGRPVPLPPLLDGLRFSRAPVCDVAWHPTQHVVAIAAYGDDHPLVVCFADRPAQPRLIAAALAFDPTASNPANLDAPDEDRAKRRKLRIKELQERRRHLLARQGPPLVARRRISRAQVAPVPLTRNRDHLQLRLVGFAVFGIGALSGGTCVLPSSV